MFTKCGDEKEGSAAWTAQLLYPPDPSHVPSPGMGLPRRRPKGQRQSHTINPNPQERTELTAGSGWHFWNELEGIEETHIGQMAAQKSLERPPSPYTPNPLLSIFLNFLFFRKLTITLLTRNQLSLSLLPEILPLRLVQTPTCRHALQLRVMMHSDLRGQISFLTPTLRVEWAGSTWRVLEI